MSDLLSFKRQAKTLISPGISLEMVVSGLFISLIALGIPVGVVLLMAACSDSVVCCLCSCFGKGPVAVILKYVILQYGSFMGDFMLLLAFGFYYITCSVLIDGSCFGRFFWSAE